MTSRPSSVMKPARLLSSQACSIHDTRRPFSNFDFVEIHFGGRDPIRRLFSLGRSLGGATLIVETLAEGGLIADENDEIRATFPDHQMAGLTRISFWNARFSSVRGLRRQASRSLLGYAVLKRDTVPSLGLDRWHVFESVFLKYPHKHNCVPRARRFRVHVGDERFSLSGVMYCQQNSLNKACAQVALRSIYALTGLGSDVSYRTINSLAAPAYMPQPDAKTFVPGQGLQAVQIRAVLDGLDIAYTDID